MTQMHFEPECIRVHPNAFRFSAETQMDSDAFGSSPNAFKFDSNAFKAHREDPNAFGFQMLTTQMNLAPECIRVNPNASELNPKAFLTTTPKPNLVNKHNNPSLLSPIQTLTF